MNNIKLLPALIAFIEVAKHQSFTRAAKELKMSKSAISQQIKRLEQALNQQLLVRHTRSMVLTSAGQKLYERGEFFKHQTEQLFAEQQQDQISPSGRFALTFPHSCEQNIVIPALRQLCREYPNIEPCVDVSDKPKDLLQDDFDIAIYAGELRDSNYRALPIGTSTEVFCASPNYLARHPQLELPKDLATVSMIAAPWQDAGIYSKKGDAAEQWHDIKFSARSNSLNSSLALAKSDMGIILAPEFAIAEAVNNGQLVIITGRNKSQLQGKLWPFYMVHRYHADKPVHIQRFYELVRDYFESGRR